MSLTVRDNCLKLNTDLPYLNRAFAQDAYFPQFGNGGNHGLRQWVDTESALTFPYYTRAPNGCSDTLELSPDLTFDFLPTKWQQDDFRPLHFQESTRQAVKDMCSTRASINDPQRYLGCQYYSQPGMWQESRNQSLENIFNDRYI